MTLKQSQVQFASQLSGLGNYTVKDLTLSVPSVPSLVSPGFQDFTVSTDLDRADTIAQVQSRFTNFSAAGDDVWRVMSGKQNIIYIPSFAAASHSFITFYSFTGSTLTITVRVSSSTGGGGITTQSVNFEARVFLFVAPFSS